MSLQPEPDYYNRLSRIVGGVVATHRWPWQALLIDRVEGRPFCGGVLIDTQHVLTAAHCFDDHNWNTVDVVLGEYDRTVEEGSEQMYTISCLIIHNDFVNQVPYHHDIAVIKLDTGNQNGVSVNINVLPICLPSRGEFDSIDSSRCYVAGWGYTGFEHLFMRTLPNTIQEAEIPLISLRDCQSAYGTMLTRRMQCAGYLEGAHRADTCKGDSGGPLMCPDERGNFKLWGITSWGNNHFCALVPNAPVPGVYTRVDKYLNWIENKIRRRTCS